jgi:hypothetical protein
MIRADAFKLIVNCARNPDMPCFWMQQTVHGFTIDQSTDTYAGADRYVNNRAAALCSAPGNFPVRSSGNIGVQTNRYRHPISEKLMQIEVCPRRLGRWSDAPEIFSSPGELHGSESANSKTGKPGVSDLKPLEFISYFRQSFIWRCRLYFDSFTDFTIVCREAANHFRPAKFNSRISPHYSVA